LDFGLSIFSERKAFIEETVIATISLTSLINTESLFSGTISAQLYPFFENLLKADIWFYKC